MHTSYQINMHSFIEFLHFREELPGGIMIIAHKDPDTGKEQKLIEHLYLTGKDAQRVAEKINLGNIMFMIGIFHDLGKADKKFQHMIKNNTNVKVDHSSAGASYIFNLFNSLISEKKIEVNSDWKELILISSYVITAHHSLYDIPDNDFNNEKINKLEKRIYHFKREDYNYSSDIVRFAEELEKFIIETEGVSFRELLLNAYEEYRAIKRKLKTEDTIEKKFYNSMSVRLFLSILKNADVFDTINSYEVILEKIDKDELNRKKLDYLNKIEDIYHGFDKPSNRINAVRTSLANQAKQRGKEDPSGIYRLNLPTGSGKILISLRYGVYQLNYQDKDRFIYITAFLSVLEQNAKDIRDILQDPNILEHHSNIIDLNKSKSIEYEHNLERKGSVYREYLLDTWDSQVVLSTMVQFCNTLFKGRSANIRRFSSMINAVIILDEVQSLPIEVTYLFNLTMNYVSKIMNSNIVLCTATQPKYDDSSIKHKIQYGSSDSALNKDLVEMSKEDRSVFERNTVYKLNNGNISSLDVVINEIIDSPDESILVILNTKKAAKALYNEINNLDERKTYYLSTDLCPAHRKDVINEIKHKLNSKNMKNSQPIICISTQLIEAGVDVDFDKLIRSYAGIDSIIQAIGRCNREGKKKTGIVKLVWLKDDLENLKKLESIRNKKNICVEIMKDIEEPIAIHELNDKFYEKYYSNNQKEMSYSLGKDKGNILDLLSINEDRGRGIRCSIKQSFKTAADSFQLVDDETKSVIVYYKQSRELISELISTINDLENSWELVYLRQIKEILQKLQPYTIGIYPSSEIENYLMDIGSKNTKNIIGREIKILIESCYDENEGVKIETNFIL